MERSAVAPAATDPVNDVVERVTEAAGQFLGGRRVVLAGLPVAAAARFVGLLRRLGSDRCLVVGTTLGTGDLPDSTDAAWVDLDIDADVMDEFRQFERVVADPPPALTAALDQLDPEGDALVLAAPYQAVPAIAGRPVVGARPPAWVALEDKTANDALFDRAGVTRPPCEIVAVDDADGLAAAAGRLDAGHGTVWSGDAREGFTAASVGVNADVFAVFALHVDVAFPAVTVKVAPDFLDAFLHFLAVLIGKPHDVDADELDAAQELGGIGFRLLHELRCKGEQIAFDQDFHEFTALAGRREFAEIHQTGVGPGVSIKAETDGDESEREWAADQVFHKCFQVVVLRT